MSYSQYSNTCIGVNCRCKEINELRADGVTGAAEVYQENAVPLTSDYNLQ